MAVQMLENQLEVLQRRLTDLRTDVGTKRRVPKDLSAITLIPEFSGTSSRIAEAVPWLRQLDTSLSLQFGQIIVQVFLHVDTYCQSCLDFR